MEVSRNAATLSWTYTLYAFAKVMIVYRSWLVSHVQMRVRACVRKTSERGRERGCDVCAGAQRFSGKTMSFAASARELSYI